MNTPALPEVSVITAFLNEERFLAEAIDSVIAQSFNNWELILIDDGSTDGSTGLSKTYAARYPGKIIYVEHPGHVNKGTAASRNLGITLTRGNYVAFLDADDVWNANKLMEQVHIMRANPRVSMLVEASSYWHSWDPKATSADITIQVGNERDRVFEAPELAETIYPLAKAAAPCPSAIITRRDALVKLGGFEAGFTGKYQLYEDQAFLTKFYLNEPVYISSQCNNLYRQHSSSCVSWVHKEGSYHVVRKYFLNWMQQYMQQHHIQYKKVHQLLRRATDQYDRPLRHFMRTKLGV